MTATLLCRFAGEGRTVDRGTSEVCADAWQGVRRRDPQTLEELVRRHQGKVYTLAYRMLRDPEDAEDLTQEALLRALAALPRLRDEQAFAPWLMRIAANLCIARLRQRARHPQETLMEEVAGPLTEEETLAHLQLEKAIAGLPARYRLALTAFYLEGRSYREAAALVGVPVGTFRTHLYRAREMLRRALGRKEELP